MSSEPQNVAPFYEGWRFTNNRLVQAVGALSDAQLGLSAAPGFWPIWAITAHIAGVRVYWLCTVFGEPGADRTPFGDASGEGWEDDLAHPRHASELVSALESTWQVVQGCLERWTPEMLLDEFPRESDGRVYIHTRQSMLMRMITHDAEHCGEISQTLGMHGLEGLDLWTGRARLLEAPS